MVEPPRDENVQMVLITHRLGKRMKGLLQGLITPFISLWKENSNAGREHLSLAGQG